MTLDLTPENIPHFVKQTRESLNLSRAELAEILGTPYTQTVTRWETGQKTPPPLVLKVLLWMKVRGRPREWPKYTGQ
jgi:DNA-binding transcriptional regulator YiaG